MTTEMQLESGMRVRCVHNKNGFGTVLDIGAEYKISRFAEYGLIVLEGLAPFAFVPSRFKPIVRVKMGRAS